MTLKQSTAGGSFQAIVGVEAPRKGHDRRPVRTSSLAGKRQRSRMYCFGDDERFRPKRPTTTILKGNPTPLVERLGCLAGSRQQPLARRHRSLQVIATRSINTIQCLSAVSWNAMCGARVSRRDVLWSLLFSLETMTAATTTLREPTQLKSIPPTIPKL
ncbi:hypothetical protein V3C99_008054 [Haemonchus contortus]